MGSKPNNEIFEQIPAENDILKPGKKTVLPALTSNSDASLFRQLKLVIPELAPR